MIFRKSNIYLKAQMTVAAGCLQEMMKQSLLFIVVIIFRPQLTVGCLESV